MTVGQARDERRKELHAILTELCVILDDPTVCDRPLDLDAVAATLHFAQPIAERLAQKPQPRHESLIGKPVAVSRYVGQTFHTGDGHQIIGAIGD